MTVKLLLFVLLLQMNAMMLKGCRNVSVQYLCEGEGKSTQICSPSLDEALRLIEHQELVCKRLSVNLTLYSHSEVLSSNTVFSNSNFSQVVLEAPHGAQIMCHSGSLYFNGVAKGTNFLMDIHIKNISFSSCGPGTHQFVPAAIFINDNCMIDIDNVLINSSNGVGLAIVDVVGRVSVTRSNFSRNVFNCGYGGGVHLTIASLSDKTEFVKCIFTENLVTPLENETKGGGLYVQFRNYSKNGVLHIQHCEFIRNLAERGGGLLAIFNDSAHNNTLLINSTKFVHNCNGLKNYNVDMAGGGAAVTIYSNATSNKIHVMDCHFIGNVAPWGGGLMIFSQPALTRDSANNLLIICHCVFMNNSAHIGAAMYIYCTSPASSPQHCNAYPVLSHSVFVHNNNLPTNTALNQSPHSVVYIGHFPTLLERKIEFFNNSGTPLHVHETSVTLKPNTLLNFTRNIAHDGGAIALYGSWMAVSKNNTLLFTNNTAAQGAGAIYSYMTEEVYLLYSHHCFIKSQLLEDPKKWNVTFNFSGNLPRAMFTTSILPCVRDYGGSEGDNIRQTFCKWRNWNFVNESCMDQIHTSPRNFSSTLTNMPVFPGIPSQHRIYAVDDFGHNVDSFFVYVTVLDSNTVRAHVINRTLTVYGKHNTNVSIQVELEATRALFMTVEVSLQDCPPGFSFDSPSLSCICSFTQHIYCKFGSDSRWNAYLIVGYCMSYSRVKVKGNYSKHLVVGRCPFTSGLGNYSKEYSHHIPYFRLPLEKEQLDQWLCRRMNRTGILCGECIANYSIDLLSNTFDCHNCSGSFKNWLIYITAEGIPPLVFFTIVLVLHISLTSGPLNGFIFFSQVLTVSTEVILLQDSWQDSSDIHPNLFSGFVVKMYSVWSLDFFRLFHGNYKMCLGPHIKVMHVLVLRYISALYPLCFLLIAFTVIELHARNCRLLVWLWRPLCLLCVRFRQAWKARTSIVDAFAAFILLSYVKIVRISLLLVIYTRIFVSNSNESLYVINYDPTVQYLSKQHVPYWCIAVVWLVTFGLVPPVLLTCYQFKCFQRCLHRLRLNRNGLRIFMDAFQGCYKDGREGGPDRRYFAGLYFIFRFFVFTVFDVALTLPYVYISLTTLFVIFGVVTAVLQPYKKRFLTYLDICFFNLLAVIMTVQLFSLFLSTDSIPLPRHMLWLTFGLIMIPLAYVSLFVLYWVCRQSPRCGRGMAVCAIQKLKFCFSLFSWHLPSSFNSSYTSDGIPDRLEHSFRYQSINSTYASD